MLGFIAIALGLLLSLIPPGSQDRPLPKRFSLSGKLPDSLQQGSRVAPVQQPRLPARTSVSPSPARLGEQLMVRASVLVPAGTRVRFEPPVGGGDFTWGAPRASKRSLGEMNRDGLGYGRADSFAVEIPLQVFATGNVTLPGVGMVVDMTHLGGRRLRARTPGVRMLILPTVTAADSAQGLKPVRGPLGAPWWERAPWLKIGLALIVVVLMVVAFRWWLRAQRHVHAPVAARAAVGLRRDPAAEALVELAQLRALDLPASERFGEHAVALTRILRRYLEGTLGTPRPGDTSSELLSRLGGGVLDPSDLLRLELLLSLWDRVKYARAPLDRTEALRCESAVEALLRRGPARAEVA